MNITYDAFAKVNLYLHVCGKRENGYHELDSLVVFAKVGDRISVKPAPTLSLTLTGPLAAHLQDETDNLVLQAARKLQKACNITTGAHITLEKNLPIAAGIGGGSGDAAATLKALCHLWNIQEESIDLHALALSLGADVPVCLAGCAAHIGGIGEKVTPLVSIPQCWIILVNPMVSLSTPSVFKARTGPFREEMPISLQLEPATFIAALKERHNDLMAPAIRIAPVIQEVLNILENQDASMLSRMSGSGATCFALFQEKKYAINASKAIQNQHKNWWVAAAPLVY